MVIFHLRFDNVYAFKDFEASFTYPKRLVKTNLDGEYFAEYPNLRYKKLAIVMGSNATGKTTFGRMIHCLFRFVATQESAPLLRVVNEKEKDAFVSMDFVGSEKRMNRIEIHIVPASEGKKEPEVLVRCYSEPLKPTDSYETAIARFDSNKPFGDYREVLKTLATFGWNFNFPMTESGFDRIRCEFPEEDAKDYCALLKSVLKTADPSIAKVMVGNDLPNSFVVQFRDGTRVLVEDGKPLSSLDRFSSGTKYAVNVASILFAMKRHYNGFYYVDEQFTYLDPDIEVSMLGLMVSSLRDGEQLILTSHNRELLEMSYPLHTYYFFTKDANGHIAVVNAADFEKRNNVSVRNMFDNDVFGTARDMEGIYRIL